MNEYLLNSSIVEQKLKNMGQTAELWNMNPGYLEQDGVKVAVWQINPEEGETFYLGFRTQKRVFFPNAGEFIPVKDRGKVLAFEDGEKFQLVCWELAYLKEFVAFNYEGTSCQMILVQDSFGQ